jgi:hypothetical protein
VKVDFLVQNSVVLQRVGKRKRSSRNSLRGLAGCKTSRVLRPASQEQIEQEGTEQGNDEALMPNDECRSAQAKDRHNACESQTLILAEFRQDDQKSGDI